MDENAYSREMLLALFERAEDKRAISLFLNWFKQLAVHGRIRQEDYGAFEEVYRSTEEVKSMLLSALAREKERFYQEGLEQGIEQGREEGREEGRVEQAQQTLLHLLQWRFALSAQEQANLAQQIAAIDDLARLAGLVDRALAAASVQDFLAQLAQPGAAADVG